MYRYVHTYTHTHAHAHAHAHAHIYTHTHTYIYIYIYVYIPIYIYAKDVNRNCTGVDGQVIQTLISQLKLANSSVTGVGAGYFTNVYLVQELFSALT